jgi:signal transduction histidine kinase
VSFSLDPQRLLWRLRAPALPAETRRIERVLATARVFLATSFLAAIYFDPAEPSRYSAPAYILLSAYIIHSIVVMMLVKMRMRPSRAFRFMVHGADIVWPAIITLFTQGPNSPFFLFFIFVLLAAAYRWGLWETIGTAVAAMIVLMLQGLFLEHGGRALIPYAPHFELTRLIIRFAYLLAMGILLGYLAEHEKQLSAQKVVIARVLGKARVEKGLSGTTRDILLEILRIFGARTAMFASQEAHSVRIYLCEVKPLADGSGEIRWPEATVTDRATYLFESPADCFYLRRKKSGSITRSRIVPLDDRGQRIKNLPGDFLPALAAAQNFQSLLAVSYAFGDEWTGRLFLFDPYSTVDSEDELRFLQELIRQIGPAVYNVFLLRRLRLRAGAVERARVARELHDGAVQSLIAVEMQVDVLRRQASSESSRIAGELERIQSLLREEVLKLRELMQQLKSLEIDSRRLVPFLADTVERFQRETGIAARFTSDAKEVDAPAAVCRELARIVQEALVNVRKHSKAHSVFVVLKAHDGVCQIVIQDDGQGFDFSGRMSYAELEQARKGPAVIKERVRSIGGDLTIESAPGQGARLEVTFAERQQAAYG